MDAPRILLCCSDDDRDYASELHAELRHAGLRPWYHQEDVAPGEPWDIAISTAIRQSDLVVVFVSPHRSKYAGLDGDHYSLENVAWTVREAGRRELPIVAVLVKGADGSHLPYGLLRCTPIDATPWRAARVVAQLRRALPDHHDWRRADLASRIMRLRREEEDLEIAGANREEIRSIVRQRLELERDDRAIHDVGPHERLGSRFGTRERIGEGAWGEVWRAYDLETSSEVAVKILYPHRANNPGDLKRFQQGVRTMLQLRHPGIVSVIGPVEHADGRYFMAMELMERNLEEAILSPDVALSQEQALAAVLHITHAIQYAHESGVVHRDIKPANILLDESGCMAKLTDFDLVKREDETHGTCTGHLGSLPYSAPEQRRRAQDAGPAADIFSVGMTLLFVLRREILSPSLGRFERAELIESLPVWAGLRRVIRTATHEQAGQRYGAADDLYAALRTAIEERPANFELDVVLERMGSHRRCLEPDLYDLLSVPAVRQCWVGVRTSLPDPCTRRFLDDALWSEQQQLVAIGSQSWIDTYRPWLEAVAYADWQVRRVEGVRLVDHPRPPSAMLVALKEAGWLQHRVAPSPPTFGHWRLACWVLASAIAERGSPPDVLLQHLDVRMASRRTAQQELAEPEASSELPGDLLWHYVRLGDPVNAAHIVERIWSRGSRAGYLRELFVEIGPPSLPVIQAHLESMYRDRASTHSAEHFYWFEGETPARIARQQPDKAADWALAAMNHPERAVRQLAYEVSAATSSWSVADALVERHEACQQGAGPRGRGIRRSIEQGTWEHEADWAMKALKLFVARNPAWLVARAPALVETDRDTARRIADGLSGSEGRAAWLQTKALWQRQDGAHDQFLTKMIRRFRDVCELDTCKTWVRELARGYADDPAKATEQRGYDLFDVIWAIAILAPSEVPRILERLPGPLVAAVPPGTFLWSLHARDANSYDESLRLWVRAARKYKRSGMVRGLRRIVDLLPPDIIGLLVVDLEVGLMAASEPERSSVATIECLNSVRTLTALHVLEAKADTEMAGAVAALARSQFTHRSGFIRGACGPLVERIGGDFYSEYTLARLEYGELEYHRAIRSLPFLPPPVDWERVIEAEVEHGRDDFSIGRALSNQRQHRSLVDWIMDRGPNGPGRYFHEAGPSPGRMDRELIRRIMHRYETGACPTLHALAALGMTGNEEAVDAVCSIQPQDSDERFVRAVALRWLSSESVASLDRVVTTLMQTEEAVALDVLWHTLMVSSYRPQARAESVLVSRLLGETWVHPPASKREGLDRDERLKHAVRDRFHALGWPPRGGRFAARGYWPMKTRSSWDPFELQAEVRSGPAHEPVDGALCRLHAIDRSAAYRLTVSILTGRFRETNGLPELLVRFDAERAAVDLWSVAQSAEVRLLHEIAVAMDRIEPRHLIRDVLIEQMHATDAKHRRLAIWLSSWQTDGLLNREIRDALDTDLDVGLQADRALERQRLAHQARLILYDLESCSPHRRFVRIEMFLDICKPSKPESPDGWAVWRRAGPPNVGELLWQRVRDGLFGLRKFDNYGPETIRGKRWWRFD